MFSEIVFFSASSQGIDTPSRTVFSVGWFEEFRECWCFQFHLIANLFRILLELGFFALLVHKDDTDRADGLARLILHDQFDFEMVALFVHFQVRLAGLDYTQVVLVRLFADPAYVRSDDDVFRLARRLVSPVSCEPLQLPDEFQS